VSVITHANKLNININVVRDLMREQFPTWSHLPIEPVALNGWDNTTFRLGQTMSIRLPNAQEYAAQVLKEQKWLPVLAPNISCSIPKPLALGYPSKNYPFNWSIYQWIEGESAQEFAFSNIDLEALAGGITQFLNELHTIDAHSGPLPGAHNFYRGGPLSIYDAETTLAIKKLQGFIDTDGATRIWQRAMSSQWNKNPVWIHGDLSVGNILVKNNRLAGIIDFGCMAVGDPACDLVIAWTLLKNESRKKFKSHVSLDCDTFNRARGWALWKAMVNILLLKDITCPEALMQKNLIDEIICDT
jgi:aminoglycoside phosphotransferase (APT) family kinase protein